MSAIHRRRSRSPGGDGSAPRERSRSPKRSPKVYDSSPLASGQLELFAEVSARRRAKAAAEQEQQAADAAYREHKARAKEIVDEFCRLNPGSRRGLEAHAADRLVGSGLSDEEMHMHLTRVRRDQAVRTEEREAAKQRALQKKDAQATKRMRELFDHQSQHEQLAKLGQLFDKRALAVLNWVRVQLTKLGTAGCLVKALPRGPTDEMFRQDELGSRVMRSLSHPNIAWERICHVLRRRGSKLPDADAVHAHFMKDLLTVLVSRTQIGAAKCKALQLEPRPIAIGELCDISDECAERLLQAARMQGVDDLLRRSIHSKSKMPGVYQRYLRSKEHATALGSTLEAGSVLKRLT